MKYRVSNKIKKYIIMSLCLLSVLPLTAQNRGNALGFQGLDRFDLPSARLSALGGSFTAVRGDVQSLYINPAGLTGMDQMQISVTANGSNDSWWENQIYRPNRRLVTLAFYLEGLYVPDPKNNGLWDHDVFYDGLLDTSYVVSLPDTGLGAYSKEAADWMHNQDHFGFSDISFAIPLTLMDKNLSVAVGIRPQMAIRDYDRNTTYLDPHIAYTEYGIVPQVDGTDTVRMNWFDYERSRTGSAMSVNAAMGMEILPWLSAGFGMEFMSGNSNDVQMKKKIGYFDLYDENMFMFSYDTLNTRYEGVSHFSSFKTQLGFQVINDHVSIGANLNMPYMINRSFSYLKTVTDTAGSVNSDISGTESVKVPLGYNLGLAFKPLEGLLVTLDIAETPFQNSSWTFSPDLEEFQREWVKQTIMAFGIEFKPFEALTLRAGYRDVTQVFVPDGAAVISKGPQQISWSMGLGYRFGQFGQLDVAYVTSDLKYYDQYFSNVNYVRQKTGRWIVGYSIKL